MASLGLFQQELVAETFIDVGNIHYKRSTALAVFFLCVTIVYMLRDLKREDKAKKLRDSGLSIRETARVLNTHKTQVHRWETYNKRDVDNSLT